MKTVHTRRRGHGWIRDKRDEELRLPIVPMIKLAKHTVTARVWDAPGSMNWPSVVMNSVARLWYSCTDVALVSGCHMLCKWPSGMWRQRGKSERSLIASVGSIAKTCCFTLWSNRQKKTVIFVNPSSRYFNLANARNKFVISSFTPLPSSFFYFSI